MTDCADDRLLQSRKPDPDVNIACYRPTQGKKWLQIYDYNLARFDISDRRGELARLAMHASRADTRRHQVLRRSSLRLCCALSRLWRGTRHREEM